MTYNFEKKLKEIIVLCGDDLNIDMIENDTDLINDLYYSSINIIQLIVQLETTFDIEIEDDSLQLDKISKYKGLVEILQEKIKEEYLC
jgi:Phosphopantetheine attachment site.